MPKKSNRPLLSYKYFWIAPQQILEHTKNFVTFKASIEIQVFKGGLSDWLAGYFVLYNDIATDPIRSLTPGFRFFLKQAITTKQNYPISELAIRMKGFPPIIADISIFALRILRTCPQLLCFSFFTDAFPNFIYHNKIKYCKHLVRYPYRPIDQTDRDILKAIK